MSTTSCSACKHKEICKWIDEEIRITVELQGVNTNESSPFRLSMNCEKYEGLPYFKERYEV